MFSAPSGAASLTHDVGDLGGEPVALEQAQAQLRAGRDVGPAQEAQDRASSPPGTSCPGRSGCPGCRCPSRAGGGTGRSCRPTAAARAPPARTGGGPADRRRTGRRRARPRRGAAGGGDGSGASCGALRGGVGETADLGPELVAALGRRQLAGAGGSCATCGRRARPRRRTGVAGGSRSPCPRCAGAATRGRVGPRTTRWSRSRPPGPAVADLVARARRWRIRASRRQASTTMTASVKMPSQLTSSATSRASMPTAASGCDSTRDRITGSVSWKALSQVAVPRPSTMAT